MQDNRKKNYIWGHDDCVICNLARGFTIRTLFGIVTMYFIPLPIILYGLRMIDHATILVTMVGIVLSLLVGGIALLSFAFVFGLAGLMIGEMIKMGKSKLYIYMGLGLMYMIMGAITYIGAVLLFNFNFIDDGIYHDGKHRISLLRSWEHMGRLPPNYEEMSDSLFTYYEHSIPSAFILSCFVLAFLIVVPNLFLAKRLGHKVPKFPPFREMRLPLMTVLSMESSLY